MTEKEKCAAGYLFNANYNPEITAEIEAMNDLCHEFNQLKPSAREEQQALLRRILGRMGENCCVNGPFWVDYGRLTTVGDFFFANRNCQIQDGGGVTFGDHVFIGPNCTFTTAEHALDPEQRNAGMEVALPIHVGSSVWFGAGCTVLAGVTIGDNTVIGAGSVVTRDIPANVIAAGVPCRVIRPITEADKYRFPLRRRMIPGAVCMTKEAHMIELRDMIESDIENYVRWFTVDTEWAYWDAPWEVFEPTTPEEERTRWTGYYQQVHDLPDSVTRHKFEVVADGLHIGWVSHYFDLDYMDNPDHIPAISIDLPEQSARSKGAGTEALRLFIEYLRGKGYPAVYTQTWSGNLPMLRVAEKLGFREVCRKVGIREVRGERYDAVTFRLDF